MTIEIKVPQLPESVTDATLVGWHKKVGESVRRDDNLVDLETDKVVLEVPAGKSLAGLSYTARSKPNGRVIGYAVEKTEWRQIHISGRADCADPSDRPRHHQCFEWRKL